MRSRSSRSDVTSKKTLGKLQEELGELVAIVGRCQIHGTEPETGEPNHLTLEKEIADVQAVMQIVSKMFGLNEGAIRRRRLQKVEHLTRWHELLQGMKS